MRLTGLIGGKVWTIGEDGPKVRIPLAIVILGFLIASAPFLAFKCGGVDSNFAISLRLILAASGPIIDALPIDADKRAITIDLGDIGQATATLAEALKVAPNKLSKLAAVEQYDNAVEAILQRGHLGSTAKLAKIQSLIRAIIASARIFYGGAPKPGSQAGASDTRTPSQAGKDLGRQLKELQREVDNP